MKAVLPDYPEIGSLRDLDSLPDGAIAMMNPKGTTPVLWARTGRWWTKLDPLADGTSQEALSSAALFQLRFTPTRARTLVLVWVPAGG